MLDARERIRELVTWWLVDWNKVGAGRPRGISIEKAPRYNCGAEYLRTGNIFILAYRLYTTLPAHRLL